MIRGPSVGRTLLPATLSITGAMLAARPVHANPQLARLTVELNVKGTKSLRGTGQSRDQAEGRGE